MLVVPHAQDSVLDVLRHAKQDVLQDAPAALVHV